MSRDAQEWPGVSAVVVFAGFVSPLANIRENNTKHTKHTKIISNTKIISKTLCGSQMLEIVYASVHVVGIVYAFVSHVQINVAIDT